VKSAQKKLETIGLPGTEEKLDMFGIAYELLTKNRYVSIGMDHYAKPDDSLSAALQKKKLHRNFQGYCTRETTGQVYGFGSSSISQLTGSYSQNQKNINKYIEEIEQNGIAVEKGYLLNELDSIRRTVINDIMCNGYLDFNQVAEIYKTTAEEIEKIVEYNPKNLNEFIEDNLLHIDGKKIILEPEGFFVVRNIAMKFDPLLTEGTGQYSKTV
jgi:oxygen-independent coproporphyrinogen-3 oxidase